jgi:hypothetical protein
MMTLRTWLGSVGTVSVRNLRWGILFLVGVASVTATAFGWRAAEIGSSAAFDDRQSISETVRVEQGRVEDTLAVAAQEREYGRYRADYAVAAALDRDGRRTEAVSLRRGATRRAASLGVFGPFSIGDDLLRPHRKPRPFSPAARARALAAEQSTALDSPGALEPDRWAASANAIRVRVNGLTRWALVVLVSIPLYTLAEMARRRRWIYGFGAAGLIVYVVGLIGGLTSVFWA